MKSAARMTPPRRQERARVRRLRLRLLPSAERHHRSQAGLLATGRSDSRNRRGPLRGELPATVWTKTVPWVFCSHVILASSSCVSLKSGVYAGCKMSGTRNAGAGPRAALFLSVCAGWYACSQASTSSADASLADFAFPPSLYFRQLHPGKCTDCARHSAFCARLCACVRVAHDVGRAGCECAHALWRVLCLKTPPYRR